MKAQYAAELTEGSRVDTAFVVRSKEMRATRSGEAYLHLELADSSGQLPGVWFKPDPATAAVPVSSVVNVRGVVTRYRGRKRVSIEALTPRSEWDPGDFLARGTCDETELLARLRTLVASITDPELGRLLKRVFGDAEFFARFRVCAAAQSYHHAYAGGLLEHTVAVAELCSHLADSYPAVDRDLLVASALVHDIGKVDELDCTTSIEYSHKGRLLGHVILGLDRISGAASRCGLASGSRMLLQLEHAVLAHHGELEWGSPKRPSTIEALLLHHADNLDAKAAGFSALTAHASRAEEVWTDASNLFRRPLYAPKPAELERPVPALEDEQSCMLAS